MKLKDLPPEIWRFLKTHRFFGMIIPKEYGGLAFSARAHSEVIQKLATRSTTACVTAMVPNSLGPAELLLRYGSDAQKQYYLPLLACGEEIPSFALTEPEAGSDASGMNASGVVCEKDNVLGIRLTWSKRYITLAPVTTLLGLAFRLYDPDGLLGGDADLGITLALVPADTRGVRIGRRHNPLGVPFQNGPTSGQDVWISLDQIIGGPDYAGQGWRMLMECLSVGRCISLPALSTGSAKLVCRMAGAYSRIRRQFKAPIAQFEGVEELLARMAGTLYIMDAARETTLLMPDRGEHPTVLSAVLKYHLTEAGRRIVNDGMDIMGGKAICDGPENLIAPLYQGIPIGITVEGANILTRNLIIFGQGSVRSHPFVPDELNAARLPDPKAALRAFTNRMAAHLQNSLINGVLMVVFGLTNGRFSRIPTCHPEQKRYFRYLNRLCAAYATLADMSLMLLGDRLKRKERLSALLGDMLSDLYMTGCVLRRFHVQGNLPDDRPLMHWAAQTLLYRAEDSMEQLLRNFPHRALGVVLRWLAFPRGRRFAPPSHRLDRAVADAIRMPGAVRDRLTEGVYLPRGDQEPLAVLEQGLTAVVAAEPLEARLRQAHKEGRLTQDTPEAMLTQAVDCGMLSTEDADRLRNADQWRCRVIRVDDFDARWNSGDGRAIADETTLRRVYPEGTRWRIDIPRTNLATFLEASLIQYADRPCLDFLGKRLTYRELHRLMDKAAAGLQRILEMPGETSGEVPGAASGAAASGATGAPTVGLMMPNTPYYPILFLGALKAGATVVNCSPMSTVEELTAQARDSGMRLLVTLDLKEPYDKAMALYRQGVVSTLVVCKMEDMLPFLKAQTYRILRASHIARVEDNAHTILTMRDLLNAGDAPIAPVTIDPEATALLQYTGGTTGTPKGAMLTHRNLIANLLQIEAYFAASPDKPDAPALLRPGRERALSSIPYFHIFGMTVSLLCVLRLGGELIILPDPRDTRKALKVIRDRRPTLFPAVPRLLQAMAEQSNVQADTQANVQGMGWPGLKAVISGGAALPGRLKEVFESAFASETCWHGVIKQGYGLTEAAPVVSSNPPYGRNRPESVGLPLPLTEIKITDADDVDRVLLLGEVGEICVRGPQVMRGYHNRDAETADVLKDGWLYTGDLGYLDDDYYLHIVDRKKRLIIVNGFNVYPSRIENAILKHPAVADCMVISVPDTRSGEAAKAFIRLRNNRRDIPAIHEIKAFLTQHLSRIELPRHIEFVTAELPKTPVGKPDWKAMQERERLKCVADPSVAETVFSAHNTPDDMEQEAS